MTVLDYSRDDDEKAVLAHRGTETHVRALCMAFGWTRKQTLEHLVAFCENDETAAVFTVRGGKPRRPRKHAEARA